MRSPVWICSAILLTLAACGRNPKQNVNPFTDYGRASTYFESECTVKTNNGDCVKATCKEDAVSNCNDWAAGCLNHDGYYQGSSSGGTCSKIL
jgi:hypothetical protein